MCSSISQFTQDIIAALIKAPPDMGGQNQQSTDQGDKQEDVPAVQAEVAQPSLEISNDRKMVDGSCASQSRKKKNDKSTTRAKKMEDPTVGSEVTSKRRKVTDLEPCWVR